MKQRKPKVQLIDGLVVMTGATGTHSVLLEDKRVDRELGVRYGRACIHVIGFLKNNDADADTIARYIVRFQLDALDDMSPQDTFIAAERRRGVLAAFGHGRLERKGTATHERRGFLNALPLVAHVTF